MWRAGLVALLCCAGLPGGQARAQAPSQAAESAAREVAEGEKLAKAGLYAESIARFKAAEAIAPRAAHDCFIALSYFRLNRLGQARLFMQRCAARARGSDPAPPWVIPMGNDVAAAISASDLAAVSITILPAEAVARVGCSAFAPDESFAANAETTIHLPAGEHTLRVEADGFAPVEESIAVTARQSLVVELTLEPTGAVDSPSRATAPQAAVSGQVVDESPGRGPWPYVTLGVAGAALVGGVLMHVKALDTKEDAESSLARYNRLANDYESQRTFTYTLYTVAVIGGAIGTWLWFRDPPDDGDGGFQASAAAAPDGAFVTLGWRQ